MSRILRRWIAGGGDDLKADHTSKFDEGVGQQRYRPRNMRPNPAGRERRSVWNINTAPSSIPHYAVMPEELVELCLRAGCPENGVVVDPFGGSGTVGRVAKRLHRQYILNDLNPKYVELATTQVDQTTPVLPGFLD